MNNPPRHLPRFLPTLTQVVRPFDVTQKTVSATPDLDAMAQSVLDQVAVLIDRRIHEEFDKLIQAWSDGQILALGTQLRCELQPTIKQAVADAVAAHLGLDKFNS